MLQTSDVVSGVKLRNIHTGDPATIQQVDPRSSRATLDWCQAFGHPKDVGWTFQALADHWERVDALSDGKDLTNAHD